MDTDRVIVTRGLRKTFGESVAVDHLDLEVGRGEVFGFVGPNGAGKTTTIRMILDLLRPTGGEVSVFGLDPRRDGVEVRRRIGYVPGDLNLPPRLTGRAYLADHAAIRGLPLDRHADELAERFDADLDRPMGELSLGNRRKIGVIDAFVHRPDLLVLDEPTGGLDPLVQQEFRALARDTAASGRTVFLSSHVLDEVQHTADRVAVLRQGRVVAEDRVESLIERLVRTVILRFDRLPPSAALAGVEGVTDVAITDTGTLQVVLSGPAGALLAAVAPHHPLDIKVAEPDLEDVFLGYYGSDGGQP